MIVARHDVRFSNGMPSKMAISASFPTSSEPMRSSRPKSRAGRRVNSDIRRQPDCIRSAVRGQTEIDSGFFKNRRGILTAAPDFKFHRSHFQRPDHRRDVLFFQEFFNFIAFCAMLNRIAQIEFFSDSDRGDDIVSLMAVNPAAAFSADNRNQRIQAEIRFNLN